MAYITGINTWVPKRYDQMQLLELFGLGCNQKAKLLFEKAAIDSRHFMVAPSLFFESTENHTTFPALEEIYPGLNRVNHLIEVSNLEPGYKNVKPSYRHICKHWCPGIIQALELASKHSGCTAIITVDLNSYLHWQPDFTKVNDIVVYSLFGDGIAVIIVEGKKKTESTVPEILDFSYYNERSDIADFQGKRIILKRDLPDKVPSIIDPCLSKLLRRHGLMKSDIEHWIVHPGGRRIIDCIESFFGLSKTKLLPSRNILRQYGNMSASSVLFVLKEIIDSKAHSGDIGLIASFGPGLNQNEFSVALCLLKWT